MKIGNFNNNVSFASKIKIVKNQKEFLKEARKSETAIEVFSPGLGGCVESSNELIYTQGLGPCTSFNIVNPKKYCFLSHYSNYPNEIAKCIEKEKKNSEKKIRGFIIGGELSCDKSYFDKGKTLFKNIPTTVLWGKTDDYLGTSACHNVKENTWYVLPAIDIELVKTPKDLKKIFEFIHIAKGDELIIDGKQIDAVDVNKNNQKLIDLGL